MATTTPSRRDEWTGAEIRALVTGYPSGGLRAVRDALPARTVRAIYAAAYELGLKRIGQKPGRGHRR